MRVRRSIRFDALNITLLVVAVLLSITSRSGRGYIFAGVLLTLFVLRAFSSDGYKRDRENEMFTGFFKRMKARFTSQKASRVRPVRPVYDSYDAGSGASAGSGKASKPKKPKADKDHKIFKCPQCKTYLRVPKGKGKILVTCANCGNKIEKKT